MNKKINLNNLSKSDLEKTLLDYIGEDDNIRQNFLNSNSKHYAIIIVKELIIVGELISYNEDIISYNGYYLSPHVIKKVTNEKFCILNGQISNITIDEFNIISKKIDNLLNEINSFREHLFNEYNSKKYNILPHCKGCPKPDKNKELIFNIDNNILRQYNNVKLKDILYIKENEYEKKLNDFNHRYETNKQNVNKFYMTPFSIGYITPMKKDSCDLWGSEVTFEKNKLTSFEEIRIYSTLDIYEAPYTLYKQKIEILEKLKKLYDEIFANLK